LTTEHTPLKHNRPTGMTGLMIVLAGQAVSILASNMTGFALSIWVFQKTSSATALGGMTSAFTIPYLLLIPLAGVFVDRYNRKLMMMVSDLTAALGTLAIFILFATDHLQIWHFYAINGVIGLGSAFQWPAYSAAITTMVPKEHYGRANGLLSVVQAGPGIVAPLLAGSLMPSIGLVGILLIDMATFLIAIGALLLVHVPPRARFGRKPPLASNTSSNVPAYWELSSSFWPPTSSSVSQTAFRYPWFFCVQVTTASFWEQYKPPEL
jgi:DHA3 family macrolide efflux protein-like MFS transporter